MGDEIKQQRWEFRRKDNDNDSSSDESESSSEAAHKNRKLVSGLISLENDEAIDNCRVQQTGMCIPCGEDQNMSKKGKREHRRSKKDSRKKSKTSVYDPAALDELKIFKESLLENLKVTRENLLSWMRKEMQKLVDDSDPRLEWREGSSGGKNARVQRGNNIEEKNIYKENIQVNNERKIEENIQHRNNFGKNVPVQRESNSEENVFAQHHNNVKETVQVQHPDEEVKFQVNYRNNFESGMKAQQCDIGSLGRSVKSNTAAGSDNLYHVKPNFQSRSTDKNVGMQHPMNYASDTRAQTYSYTSLESLLTGKRTAQSISFHPLVEHKVDCVQEIGSQTSSDKQKGGRLGLSIEPNFSSNLPSQVASSMYLTLPTVLTKPCGKNHMLSTSSSNYIGTPFDRNKLDVNSGKANPMLNVNGGKLSGMQQEERNGSFAQIGSRSANCFDKQSVPSSSIPFHQGKDIGHSIPSQVSSEYLPREEKNIMGLKMDEGASSFFRGSYTISEDYFANNLYGHSMSKAHGTLKALQNQDLQEGHLFPK